MKVRLCPECGYQMKLDDLGVWWCPACDYEVPETDDGNDEDDRW